MIKTYCYSFQEIIVSPVEMYLMEISFVCYTLLYIFPSFGCLYIYIYVHITQIVQFWKVGPQTRDHNSVKS